MQIKQPEVISAASAVSITIEIHLNENVFAYAVNNMENASPPPQFRFPLLWHCCPNIIRTVLDRTWMQSQEATPLSLLHLLSYSDDS